MVSIVKGMVWIVHYVLSSFQQLGFFVGTLHTLRHGGSKEVKVINTTGNALQDNLIYFS